jgi:hypothetical protein
VSHTTGYPSLIQSQRTSVVADRVGPTNAEGLSRPTGRVSENTSRLLVTHPWLAAAGDAGGAAIRRAASISIWVSARPRGNLMLTGGSLCFLSSWRAGRRLAPARTLRPLHGEPTVRQLEPCRQLVEADRRTWTSRLSTCQQKSSELAPCQDLRLARRSGPTTRVFSAV